MRCFLEGLRWALSARLHTVKGWLILLLLPLLILAAGKLLPQEDISASVQVGVALPDHGAEEFWERLQARSGTIFTFVLADEETINRNVATGRWDCGLVLADDFAECLEELDTDRLFTLQIGPGSAVYPLVRETVAACVAELISPGIAQEYLTDSGIVSEGDALRQLQPLPGSDRVLISMTTADGKPLDALHLADAGTKNILRWLISAVLLAWLLLATTDLGRRSETGAAKRMGAVRSATWQMASFIAADMILAAISGVAAVLLLGGGAAGCGAVIAYILFLGMLAVLLAHFRPVWTALSILMPFVLAASLLLSSALVDISLLLPLPNWLLSHLPAALFLRACDGYVDAVLILLAMAGACLTCSVLADRMRKREP